MKRKWLAVMLVALLVGLAGTVLAFGPGHGRGGYGCPGGGPGMGAGFGGPGMGGGFGGGLGHMAALNLSKEQSEKLWQINEKFHADTASLRFEMFQKGQEMRKLFADPKAEEATLAAKQKDLSALRQKVQDKKVQMRLEQRKVLTAEQIQKLGEAPSGRGFGAKGRGQGINCPRG
jgi:Spy/CpxP family protein refolding chaperone